MELTVKVISAYQVVCSFEYQTAGSLTSEDTLPKYFKGEAVQSNQQFFCTSANLSEDLPNQSEAILPKKGISNK